MREARVWFNTFDADVWAVETEVRGGFGNLPSGSSLFVALNSTPIPHTVGEGGTFAAVCRLLAGNKVVTAECLETNGTPIEEARITLVNKVPCRPKAVIAVEINGDNIKLSGSGRARNEVSRAPVAVW